MTYTEIENRPQTLSYIIPKATKQTQRSPLHLASNLKLKANQYTGKSTAIALNSIANAIRQPYTWILLDDHRDGVEADKHLFMLTKDAVYKLGLVQFYFKESGKSFYIAFGDPK